MKPSVLSIVILILIARTSEAALFMKTPAPGELTPLYRAAVDIVMTCYEDRSNAIGVAGDSDGSILKTLRDKYSVPVVLVDTKMKIGNAVTNQNLNHLQIFVIVIRSPRQFMASMKELANSIWWNHNANFLMLKRTSNKNRQCMDIDKYLSTAFNGYGVLDAQFICLDRTLNVSIFNFNPFIPQAPKPWELFRRYDDPPYLPFTLFRRIYQRGKKTCEALNFVKTHDAGGDVLCFMTPSSRLISKFTNTPDASLPKPRTFRIAEKMNNIYVEQAVWLVNTIANNLNVSADVTNNFRKRCWSMLLSPMHISNFRPQVDNGRIYTMDQFVMIAMTQHTGHKSQLEKILTVIDEQSRIGVYLVYLVTFIFFKFFLGQAVIPALLNLVRLTCNTGLTKLPSNVVPTIYLASLFIYVVTLQGIFTGNLASLLTKTISYPHVNTKLDIPKLGYTVYIPKVIASKLMADPVLEGCIVEDKTVYTCRDRVLADPLAACVLDQIRILTFADYHKFHVSRDLISHDYQVHMITSNNPFQRGLESLFSTFFECHLRRHEDDLTLLRYDMVEDDEVKKNTFRRIMNLDDLAFTFVILGIGLTCSFICFIGEIVIWRIRLKIAKRKARSRRRLAWGIIEKKS